VNGASKNRMGSRQDTEQEHGLPQSLHQLSSSNFFLTLVRNCLCCESPGRNVKWGF
jgi:hypothetical protein